MLNARSINDCAPILFLYTLICNLFRNAKKNRPFPGSNKGQVSASVFEDHRLRRTDLTIVHDSPSTRARPDVMLFENSRTVNCQTRFLCSRIAISESHGSCSASFYVRFLFMLLDGAKTHNLALERLVSYHFVCILLCVDC